MDPFNINSIDSIFHPSFISYLDELNPIKNEKDFSCSSYYYYLKDRLEELKPDILDKFIAIHPSYKQSFKDAYIIKIKTKAKHYVGYPIVNALYYLKQNNCSIETLFESDPSTLKHIPESIPLHLETTFRELKYTSDDSDVINYCGSVFSYLSDYFVEKLLIFTNNLPTPDTNLKEKNEVASSIVLPDKTTLVNSNTIPFKFNTIDDIFNYINDGIYQIELFIDNKTKFLKGYDLIIAFDMLFSEISKTEDNRAHNIDLVRKYSDIIDTIIKKSNEDDIEKTIDINNETFLDYRENLLDISDNIYSFLADLDLIPGLKEEKHSILDITEKKEEITPPATANDRPIRKTKIIPTAYKYIKISSNLPALTDVLRELKKNCFVSDDTDIKDFRKIFNETKPDNLIIWSGNPSELAYFIKLIHIEFKVIKSIPVFIWQVTSQLFVDSNNQPFDWKKLRGLKPPINKDLLNEIASLLV